MIIISLVGEENVQKTFSKIKGRHKKKGSKLGERGGEKLRQAVCGREKRVI
jgi:hypothetical protein